MTQVHNHSDVAEVDSGVEACFCMCLGRVVVKAELEIWVAGSEVRVQQEINSIYKVVRKAGGSQMECWMRKENAT
ncbi:hypothetical protein VNO80_24968 [Phaseolus coccineus]|uniref:Uncharacterized protein n=1 Tax=Phaseolus coccineus TaxID=3886 RepID=A0AAN9LUE6_PHACN